jgi:adhesin transport system membrane fusion protein
MNKKLTLLDDTSIQTLKGPSFFSHIIFFIVVLFVIIAFTWAKLAILDEVTTGEGKVIPSQEIQIIQNLEGGIIGKILVHEGEIVEKDQVLAQIDDTRFSSSYKEAQNKIANYQIEILRLTAENENKPFIIPPELQKENPSLISAKRLLYETKMAELKQLKQGLTLIQRELLLTQPLVAKGAVSEVEILRIRRTANEIQSKILAYNSKTLSELTTARSELNALMASHMADKDRLKRTTIRAPLKGIIKQIKISTIGGVVKPGMDIMEIVPFDDTLLIEAKIRPADIGFIHPKQKTIVKLTAYDFSIYGGLKGTVEHISADTILDEDDKSFYLIRVRTKKNYLGSEKKPLYIIPGMLASVDILTGKKSVLDYILKPILKARERALRER